MKRFPEYDAYRAALQDVIRSSGGVISCTAAAKLVAERGVMPPPRIGQMSPEVIASQVLSEMFRDGKLERVKLRSPNERKAMWHYALARNGATPPKANGATPPRAEDPPTPSTAPLPLTPTQPRQQALAEVTVTLNVGGHALQVTLDEAVRLRDTLDALLRGVRG
jgi:hypothetical protein